eukprot:Skav235366  [mRNA]  locus=scaffold3967:86626:89097:+ [translate_table: standard]
MPWRAQGRGGDGRMINFIPKTCSSVALLYGKRPLQRIAVGAAKQQLEIPLDVVADIPTKVDASVSYVGNKYNALPWKDEKTGIDASCWRVHTNMSIGTLDYGSSTILLLE